MELLTIVNNRLQVSPYALVVKEFKDIWDRDLTITKDTAIAELSFVHFMCDFKSPFRGYESIDKIARIIKEVRLPTAWISDSIIKSAIEKYNILQETPSMRLLKFLEESLVQIEKFVKGYNPATDLTGSKFRAMSDAIKKAPDIFKSINSIKEIVEQEVMTAKRVRGGHTTGRREVPRDTKE